MTGTVFAFSTHGQKVLAMPDRAVDMEDGEVVRLRVRCGDRWAFAMRPEQAEPAERVAAETEA